MSPDEEMRVRRDTELRTLRKVHQRAKLANDWGGREDPWDWGYGGREIEDMIEELIRQAEADLGIPDGG